MRSKNNRLVQLLCITEVVLGTYLWTILTIDKDDCLIGNIEGCNGTTYEIIATRAIYNVKLLIVPLHMKNGREH